MLHEHQTCRSGGLLQGLHPGFTRSPVPFFCVAASACGNKVLPAIFTTPGARVDVIDGQGKIGSAAILALKAVSLEDVLAVDNDFFVGHPGKHGQSYNARQRIAAGNRRDYPFRVVHHRNGFPVEEQKYGFLSITNA